MSRIELPSGTPAELALPPEGDPLRGLVIAPDIAGLRPLFDDMCARLATENGWAVCAVEPYPEPSAPSELPDRLAGGIDVGRVIDDLEAAADLLEEQTGVARVAVLGFCQGGMNAFRAAGTGRFDKAVAFYGMVRPPAHWSSPGNDPLDASRRCRGGALDRCARRGKGVPRRGPRFRPRSQPSRAPRRRRRRRLALGHGVPRLIRASHRRLSVTSTAVGG